MRARTARGRMVGVVNEPRARARSARARRSQAYPSTWVLGWRNAFRS
jgi:hypothetical protein